MQLRLSPRRPRAATPGRLAVVLATLALLALPLALFVHNARSIDQGLSRRLDAAGQLAARTLPPLLAGNDSRALEACLDTLMLDELIVLASLEHQGRLLARRLRRDVPSARTGDGLGPAGNGRPAATGVPGGPGGPGDPLVFDPPWFKSAVMAIPDGRGGEAALRLVLARRAPLDGLIRDTLGGMAIMAGLGLAAMLLWRRLRASERQFRDLYDQTSEARFRLDASGRLLDANPALAALLGLGWPVAGLGTDAAPNFLDHLDPDARQAFVDALSRDGRARAMETRLRRTDGGEVQVALTAVAEEGPGGPAAGLALDLTERQRRRQAEKDRHEAEEAARAKTDFLVTVSHEIRTPLNAVAGLTELLAATPLSAAQREYVSLLGASVQSLTARVNDILDLSSIESRTMALYVLPFDPVTVMDEVYRKAAVLAADKRLEFVRAGDAQAPRRVLGDPKRLRQALENLVDNAIKFTERGRVSLSLATVPQAPAATLRFTVADTGGGIPPDMAQAIFEPFTQADSSTTRRRGGVGVGLTLARELARLMGGEVTTRPNPAGGTIVEMTIPFAPAPDPVDRAEAVPPSAPGQEAKVPTAGPGQEHAATALGPDLAARDVGTNTRAAATPAEEAAGPPPEALAEAQGPKRSVLLVDDNPSNRLVLSMYLDGAPVCAAMAENGRQAVEAYVSGRFDLVIMDVEMPEMDGYEATRSIREIERRRGLDPVPVYALSAHAFEEHRDKALAAGCTGFLTKPVTRRDFLALLDVACPAPADLATEATQPADATQPTEATQPTDASRSDSERVLVNPRLEKLMPLFFDSARATLRELRQGLAAGDPRAAGQLAHKLKGSARTYGFYRLGEMCQDLERGLLDGTDRAGLLIGEIEAYLSRVEVVYA